MFCSVNGVNAPVAATPLVIDVSSTGAVRGVGGALVVAQATTPLATNATATLPRTTRSTSGLSQPAANCR
jgi:hypothetical protein